VPAISVVVVNYNGAALLEDCLLSLRGQTFRDFEVVLVDNGSVDNSISVAASVFPQARCVVLAENVGFAKGSNIGIRQSDGEYVVLLNNDTQAEPTFLEELVGTAVDDAQVGMVAPKILDFFDRQRIDSAGGLVMSRDALAQGRGRGERDEGQYDALTEILVPSACAALYRREMLNETGLFDESFFMYCEDLDLGLRGRWAGWKAVAAARAVVYHKYSATSSPYSPLKMRLVERNHYLVALKNFPRRMLLEVPFWSVCRYALMARAVVRGDGKGRAAPKGKLLWAFVAGHMGALWRAPAAFRRRTRVRRVDTREFVALLKRHRLGLGRLISSD